MMTTQQMAALIEGYVEYGPKRIVSAEARFLFYLFWGFADPKLKLRSAQKKNAPCFKSPRIVGALLAWSGLDAGDFPAVGGPEKIFN